MDLLITLLIAHLFADFPLQTNALANLKEKHWYGVFLHVLVHVSVMALLISNSQHYWPLIFSLGVAHFLIDLGKLFCPAKKGVRYFLVDQLLHVSSILIATYIAQQVWHPAPTTALPDGWSLLVLSGALVPALMVLIWVWLNTLSQEYIAQFQLLHWTKHRLLTLEQSIGIALIGFVFLQSTLYSLVSLVKLGQR